MRHQLCLSAADYKATDESAPVTAKKEIKLLRLPRILVLHMCRFTYNSQGLTKLHKQMQFSLKLRSATHHKSQHFCTFSYEGSCKCLWCPVCSCAVFRNFGAWQQSSKSVLMVTSCMMLTCT